MKNKKLKKEIKLQSKLDKKLSQSLNIFNKLQTNLYCTLNSKLILDLSNELNNIQEI